MKRNTFEFDGSGEPDWGVGRPFVSVIQEEIGLHLPAGNGVRDCMMVCAGYDLILFRVDEILMEAEVAVCSRSWSRQSTVNVLRAADHMGATAA